MIRGYPRWPSVLPGEALTLHVASDAPRFRVEFYRQGVALERVEGVPSEPLAAVALPDGPPDRDWGWPGYEFAVPADWRSGAYVAALIEIDADGNETAPDMAQVHGPDARALFVVRAPAEARRPIVYKLADHTWQAYNGTGHGCLYAEPHWSRDPHGYRVTTRRPGGATGGVDHAGAHLDGFDPDVPRTGFQKWDAPFVAWLEGEGFEVDYCTDWDVHRDPATLDGRRLLLSVGHDEYWSPQERANVERFVDGGGNVAFFSADSVSYVIHYADSGTAIATAKRVRPGFGESADWPLDLWKARDPQARLMGVETELGIHWWSGRREPVGYRVQHADHWIYEGTGLADGDELGAGGPVPLVGFETSGAPYAWRHGVAEALPVNGTPREFLILGIAEHRPGWIGFPGAAATMGILTRPEGGTVFTGSTTDWATCLSDAAVARITRNVIERLALPPLRLVGPLPTRRGEEVAVAGAELSFHVDTHGLAPGLRYEWRLSGVRDARPDGWRASATAADRGMPVTVAVTAYDGETPVAFGTKVVRCLTELEGVQLEICGLLRELAMPAEPSFPLVSQTSRPIDHIDFVEATQTAMFADLSRQLVVAADRLLELHAQVPHMQGSVPGPGVPARWDRSWARPPAPGERP